MLQDASPLVLSCPVCSGLDRTGPHCSLRPAAPWHPAAASGGHSGSTRSGTAFLSGSSSRGGFRRLFPLPQAAPGLSPQPSLHPQSQATRKGSASKHSRDRVREPGSRDDLPSSRPPPYPQLQHPDCPVGSAPRFRGEARASLGVRYPAHRGPGTSCGCTASAAGPRPACGRVLQPGAKRGRKRELTLARRMEAPQSIKLQPSQFLVIAALC